MAKTNAQDASGPAALQALLFEGLRFIGGGLLVFPLGLLASAFCHEVLGWAEQYAGLAAFATLLLVNFVLGRIWVFRSFGGVRHELVRFVMIATAMRGAEYMLFLALVNWAQLPYLVALAGTLATSSGAKFVLYRTWVFTTARSRTEVP